MEQIGRKIYYELATGNVIVETGERQGSVVATTETEDFALYTALQPYQQSAVGVLQLSFGDYAQNFEVYPFHIDITKTPPVIAWDTANPIGATLTDVQKSKIAQLQNMYTQQLALGFTSSANGTATIYGYAPSDVTNMHGIATASVMGIETWPVSYADIHGNVVNLTQVQFTQLCKDANNFNWAQVGQLRSLVGQVAAATTVTAVQAIQWTPATY